MARLTKLAIGMLILSLSIALLGGVYRLRAELADRKVELIADYETVAAWASATGSSVEAVLRRLKREGLTACSLPELSLLDMGQKGLAEVEHGPGGAFVRLAPEVRDEAVDSLKKALGGRLSIPEGKEIISAVGVYIPSPPSLLPTLPLAFDPTALEAIGEAGLRPVPRPTSHPLASLLYVEGRLDAYWEAGANLLVFAGDTVWGHPRALSEVARWLKEKGFTVAVTEFAKQAGDVALASKLLPHVVRLHSITEREVQNYTLEGMVARFARAVKERRVRAVYIRLPSPSGTASFEEAAKVVSETARLIRASGYEPGGALTIQFPDFVSNRGGILAAFGGCIAFYLALSFGFKGLGSLGAFVGAIPFLLLFGLTLLTETLGAKLCALSAALSFPALGVVLAHRVSVRGKPLRAAFKALLVASGVSLGGGLLVATSLTSPFFLLKLDQYAGVKLSFVLPVLAVGLWRLGAGYEIRPYFHGWWVRLSESSRRPLLYGHVVGLLFLLGLAALWILRTGNVPEIQPPAFELKLRELLEKLLYARPRFKEFAFSHPLLMLAALLERRARPGVVALLWAAGAIGQASIVNSFCHLHTPLLIAVLRTVNGVWLGALFGGVICWALWGLLPMRKK